MHSLHVDGAGHTDIGRTRSHNEDQFLVGKAGWVRVFAVADGIGGEAAGEVASALAVTTFAASLQNRIGRPSFFNRTRVSLERAVREATEDAHRAVRACAVGPNQGMATTLTALVVSGHRGVVVHVGDSRLYRLRAGRWERLTQDHSLAEELPAGGSDGGEERIPRHLLTRAMGISDALEADVSAIDVQPGDRFLLCTDGLSGPVEDEVLSGVLLESITPASAVRALVGAALERGGRDNITAVVAHATSIRPWPFRAAVAVILVALLAGGAALSAKAWVERSYFLGVDGREIVVFRGMPITVGQVRLFQVEQRTGIDLGQVTAPYRERVRQGILLERRQDAGRLLHDLTVPSTRTPLEPPSR